MEITKLDDFITQMPKNLPDTITKARFLYLELGKRSFYSRNIEYLMFGEEEELLIYSRKPYTTPNIVVCATLNKQYLELLQKLGIFSKIIQDGQHSFLVFEDEDGINHIADLTRDLKNIQFGCSTSFFANNSINDSKLRAIDLFLGYITKNRGYSDDYWYILRDKIASSKMPVKQKFETVLNSLQEFGDLSKLGKSELFYMYKKFVNYCSRGEFDYSFYGLKKSGSPEEFIIELDHNNKRTKYKLNDSTLKFEQFKEIDFEEHSK